MWTWKQKSVSVVKQKYGHDESAPTPDGVFVVSFVGECGVFADCSLCISLRECCVIPICPQYFGSPFVAYCLCIYGLFE